MEEPNEQLAAVSKAQVAVLLEAHPAPDDLLLEKYLDTEWGTGTYCTPIHYLHAELARRCREGKRVTVVAIEVAAQCLGQLQYPPMPPTNNRFTLLFIVAPHACLKALAKQLLEAPINADAQ